MSMLDSFFNKGFKATKCKTLLKLTIPRIKLLRNRRELQIKQMRRDIAKLLETGQEATARIRVEHIIREENMMAAQEILELFCELIAVRLPIIEVQRECPLDLKEAISSVCFASPRCADLPELLQVQMLFAAKYGREFVAAATELMPESGVNRQLIELLSVRAPPAEKKLQLLKEIAEEHGLDWDPAASETELFKPHEDLLNGPRQFVGGSQVPLPKEKHDEVMHSALDEGPVEVSDSDVGLDPLEFPEVPKVLLRPSAYAKLAPEIGACLPSAPHPEVVHESITYSANNENSPCQPSIGPEDMAHEQDGKRESLRTQVSAEENKQFVPFITLPSLASASFSTRDRSPSPSLSKTRSEASVDLQDVLAAAESAERAAAAAQSAASLAEVRISELTKNRNDESPDSSCENPFHADYSNLSAPTDSTHLEHQNPLGDDSVNLQSQHETPAKAAQKKISTSEALKKCLAKMECILFDERGKLLTHHVEDPGDPDNDGQVKAYLKETFLNECQMKIMGESPDRKPDSNGSGKRSPVCSNGQGSANTLPICEATYVAAEDCGDCEVGDHVKTVKGPQEATWDSVATFHLAALLINLEDNVLLMDGAMLRTPFPFPRFPLRPSFPFPFPCI